VLSGFLMDLGAEVRVDAAGNLRGLYAANPAGGPRLLIGSHIDTVPSAGAFDGVLGVVLGLALLEALEGRRFRFGIEVVGFSEEEGVRFGVPFLGSRALVGSLDAETLQKTDRDGRTVEEAIRDFGLDPRKLSVAVIGSDVIGFLEFHIEQGPLLESLNQPLGVVECIAGQTRLDVAFRGQANHAGTTPMPLRRDALAGAAEWFSAVEREGFGTDGLVATVGRVKVRPGASNIIPGQVEASLDVRHARDDVRRKAVDSLIGAARRIAAGRALQFQCSPILDHPAVTCDSGMTDLLERAMTSAGYQGPRMTSGAGHDAMVLASTVPTSMLFLRSPGGVSHHPDESVWPSDVAAAIETGLRFLAELEEEV